MRKKKIEWTKKQVVNGLYDGDFTTEIDEDGNILVKDPNGVTLDSFSDEDISAVIASHYQKNPHAAKTFKPLEGWND